MLKFSRGTEAIELGSISFPLYDICYEGQFIGFVTQLGAGGPTLAFCMPDSGIIQYQLNWQAGSLGSRRTNDVAAIQAWKLPGL